MAAVDAALGKRSLEERDSHETTPHKRFKVSDLPLSQGQKSGIDGLVHTIKKKGLYDKLRHQVLAQYNESVCYDDLQGCACRGDDADCKYLAGENCLHQFVERNR